MAGNEIVCRFCQWPLHYIHGHGACINPKCMLRGQNQAECCTGETQQPAEPAKKEQKAE